MGKADIIKKVRYALHWMPDEAYIQLNYFIHFHRFANLKQPVTFNEKLNWLKLHDHNPAYCEMVDKYDVKGYVAKMIGEEYCIPTLGVWDNFDDIDFDALPESFVLKCTHDSHGIVLVRDKNLMNKAKAREKLSAALGHNFYYIGREWPYKNLRPRIIAEPYLVDDKTGELRDYKFFCFNGVPKALYIASERESEEVRFDYFDMDFEPLDIIRQHPRSSIRIDKPERFDEMIELSRKLSKGLAHVRVDLYEVNAKVYFGELTFYPSSGFIPFHPATWDRTFGDWLELPDL